MDRRIRQHTASGTPTTPASPAMSPMHRHARSGSVGVNNVRKAQTKAAAQRLAQVMSHKPPVDDDDDDEDDLSMDYVGGGIGSIGLAGGRKVPAKTPSPMRRPVARTPVPVKSNQRADEEDDSQDRGVTTGPMTGGRASVRSARTHVPVKTIQYADEEDDSQDHGLTSGTVTVGRAGVRSTRTPVPSRSYQYADEEDDSQDNGLTSGSMTVGRAGVKPTRTHVPSRSYQFADDEVDSDDYELAGGPVTIGRPSVRPTQGRAPMTVRTQRDNSSSSTSLATGSRSALSVKSAEQQSLPSPSPLVQPSNAQERSSSAHAAISVRSSTNATESPINSPKIGRPSMTFTEQPTSARSLANRASTNSLDQSQPPSARSTMSTRASTGSLEQLPSGHPSSAAHLGIKAVPLPSSVPISLRPSLSSDQTESPRKRRLSMDLGSMKIKETTMQNSASNLEDELDMLQEENESLVEKIRIAEERFEEADARAKQLEKQIANLGEGVTLEARLLTRKEAALQQREAALKVVEQACKTEELDALRNEAEVAKEEAARATKQLQESELELKWLRSMTRRVILTEDEQEEVVMKRCWLARYWGLCVKHGIHQEISRAKHKYWSSLAPLPFEVVLAAGHSGRDDDDSTKDDTQEREKALQEAKEISGRGSVESIVLVERGLRQLASLKIEEAVALAMAIQRGKSASKSGEEELHLPSQGLFEDFALSEEESEDVSFKQAWLIYFWRRAMKHGIEQEIAEERLQYWIEHSNQSSLFHNAVDVERGLFELRKLGIENQLWQESRRGLEYDGSNADPHAESEF